MHRIQAFLSLEKKNPTIFYPVVKLNAQLFLGDVRLT